MNYRNELERALNGKPGELGDYLECCDDAKVAADIKALIETPRELRDEFAMAALQGMLAGSAVPDGSLCDRLGVKASDSNAQEQCFAKQSYLFADAMLAARSAQKESALSKSTARAKEGM